MEMRAGCDTQVSQSTTLVVHAEQSIWCVFLSVCPLAQGWLSSRVVSVLDSGAVGPGFKSQPRRCRVTVLGKLFTPIVPLFTKQQKLVAALLRVEGVTQRL